MDMKNIRIFVDKIIRRQYYKDEYKNDYKIFHSIGTGKVSKFINIV